MRPCPYDWRPKGDGASIARSRTSPWAWILGSGPSPTSSATESHGSGAGWITSSLAGFTGASNRWSLVCWRSSVWARISFSTWMASRPMPPSRRPSSRSARWWVRSRRVSPTRSSAECARTATGPTVSPTPHGTPRPISPPGDPTPPGWCGAGWTDGTSTRCAGSWRRGTVGPRSTWCRWRQPPPKRWNASAARESRPRRWAGARDAWRSVTRDAWCRRWRSPRPRSCRIRRRISWLDTRMLAAARWLQIFVRPPAGRS